MISIIKLYSELLSCLRKDKSIVIMKIIINVNILFLLILIAFLKILLAPIFSGEQAPVYIREKGYYKITDDHYKAKPEKEYFRIYEKVKPGKWRR